MLLFTFIKMKKLMTLDDTFINEYYVENCPLYTFYFWILNWSVYFHIQKVLILKNVFGMSKTLRDNQSNVQG